MFARRPWILHPMLFALYPIAHLYATNLDLVSPSETLFPLAISLLMAAVTFLLIRLVVRDGITAGAVTSAILILFFSYGHAWKALTRFYLAMWDFPLPRHEQLLLLWGLLFLLTVLVVAKARRLGRSVNTYLNVVAAVLVSLPILSTGTYAIKRAALGTPGAALGDHTRSELTGTLPDIYYVILDSYARSDILRESYGHDNSEFIEHLRDKGFYVADKSRSNYAFTYLSLASSLNMQYLDSIRDRLGENSKDRTIPLSMIAENQVSRTLKAAGYRIVHFSSGYGPTEHNRLADINYSPEVLNDFRTMLLETTLLNPLVVPTGEAQLRAATLFTFETIGKIPQIEDPTFVFAHVIVPHVPFVFDHDCNAAPSTPYALSRPPHAARQYVEQLICVSTLVEILADEILSRSQAPPVIIFQADHGRESIPESEHPTDPFLKERMSIFNAYYLPDNGARHLYPSITPVNSFRLIFDLYLGTDLGLLEDRSYFSNFHHPYHFMEVGEW